MFRTWFSCVAVLLLAGCTSQSTSSVPTGEDSSMAEIGSTAEVVSTDDPTSERADDSSDGESADSGDESVQAKSMAEFESIQADYQAAVKQLRAQVDQVTDKEEQVRILAENNPVAKFGAQYMALAKKYPGTKASLNATLFVVGQNSGKLKNEAMTYLIENHAENVKLSKVAESLKSEVPRPEMEDWFQLMIDKAEPGPVQASVMLSYAQYVGQIPTFKRTLELNPQVANRLSQSQLDYINAPRTKEQDEKLASILETMIEDYGDVKYRGRETFGQVGASQLFELTRLQVGMVAPDIEGQDLDDIPFKLSDYRGKVVMLDFWGHWCPPCRAMYSHEQEVARSLADKPFVLLGVNSDGDKDTAIDAVQSESLSWRHFWNGPKGNRGPISKKWNVEGWPTVYLIDQDGVIRFKEVLGEDIDRGIETLMAEMGHEVKFDSSAQ